MDQLANEFLKMGLLGTKGQSDETGHSLAMIQRFAEAVSRDQEKATACQHFVRIIIEETCLENCSILFWNQLTSTLSLVAAYGLDDQLEVASHRYRQNLRFGSGHSISELVFSSGESVFIENTAKHPIPEMPDAVVTPVSLACVPILNLGVLNLSANRPQKFTDQIRRNWEIVGKIIGHLTVGLQHAGEAANPARPQTAASVNPNPKASNIPELILDLMPQGICILDTEGTIVRINRSIEKMQGEKLPDITGRSPAVLFQDSASFGKLLAMASESDAGRVEKTDVNLMNSSGETYLADIYLVRLEEEGRSAGYLLVIEDITKKKAFSSKIIQSEKLAALGTMAGGVSHDFNNLLMAVLGHVQLILPQIEDEEVRRRLQNIEKAVYDGSNTVRRLQRFTERERDPKAAASPIDVEEAVKDVIELTRPRWKSHMEMSGHTIDIRLDLALNCFAMINASDLKEVLTNLLLNAIDAMPQGGVVTFRSYCQGEEVFLDVSDTGIGMSKDVAERIFDPFFTTKGIGNSGLGLSVSWSLIGRYGGDIQVKSKSGKGTTFTIKLARAEAAKAQAISKTCEGSSSYSILLVEDEPEILNLLRDMLRLKGHHVVAMSDGEKALELIDSSNFDLVLTDLGMPVVSGWEVAKRAKAKNPKTPVVMITGWGAKYEDIDLASRGVDLMLAKPLSCDSLLSSIEKLL
ncbi:MAG: ATP-binding protein [Syntrophobacteraceae bacterium]